MSTTRRCFLRGAAFGMVALPMLAMPAARSRFHAGRIRFDCVVYDARRVQALGFGETARQLGARTCAMTGAIDDPCYEDLRRRWRDARTPVAGITDFRALSLLQTMASDAGMRPVLRICHRAHGASMVHEVCGSDAQRAQAAEHLARAGIRWSSAAARLILSLAVREPEVAGDAVAANPGVLDSRALVTWAIA